MVASDKAEREKLTQLARAGLYAQGKLGHEAIAVPVLVDKRGESVYRVEIDRRRSPLTSLEVLYSLERPFQLTSFASRQIPPRVSKLSGLS